MWTYNDWNVESSFLVLKRVESYLRFMAQEMMNAGILLMNVDSDL